ncbi:hypothetical protein FB563_8373 [Streptomyces puniciscabiei]|uniref:Uncharacterized protein n=1 Tax=Streptomyces puniciscabiei TaxID=164348 RepID=A0A542SX19_9ACTN|nr:hypothetical protein [Streptomyces puniciscabiei]TQK79152.1 hypothetical protein FB563_8373 [Streptomyces puniciscabiei]
MRRIQRAAVVAAAAASLSVLGAGVSFAGGHGAPPQITAVANSQATAMAVGGGTAVANSEATAVATWGGYEYNQPRYAPQSAPYAAPQTAPAPYSAPQAAPETAPQAAPYSAPQYVTN